ncbi:hypothetical protein ASF20_19250 [Methylobacterium sp. Leaf88]|nr:hypothetical protein ASF20_19250 [Methylobacterium sp. Leaf88]
MARFARLQNDVQPVRRDRAIWQHEHPPMRKFVPAGTANDRNATLWVGSCQVGDEHRPNARARSDLKTAVGKVLNDAIPVGMRESLRHDPFMTTPVSIPPVKE